MICKCGHPKTNHFSFNKRPCAHCDCKVFDQRLTNTQEGLRKLRMWHWKQVLRCSKTLNSKLSNKSAQTRWRNAWNLHMGAVQLLNEFFETTAEQDCEQRL